ncbi:MAG: hypothetical protein AAGD14_09715 [Planctomycetota bacterium]
MRELDHALDQIREIRSDLERARVYRGYRAGPTAVTSALAAGTGWLQVVANPPLHAVLALWIACAVASAAVIGASMLRRPSPRTREALRCLAWPVLAGALVTVALFDRAPELLPGLWQIFYALALFASLRLLPRGTILVALFFLTSGLLVLGSTTALAMAVPFAGGQLVAAWLLDRSHG